MPSPGLEAVEDFCAFANPLYEQIKVNERNSTQLEELRDALLPKLMSGEIDVSEIDLTQLNSHLAKALLPFECHALATKKRGSSHSRELPRSPNYHTAAPAGTAPLLPKDRAEQALTFGLFFSIGALGCSRHLA